jgi:hypothetical protein
MRENKLEETYLETHKDTSARYRSIFLRLSPPKDDPSTNSDFSVNSVTGLFDTNLEREDNSTSWLAKKLNVNSLSSINCTAEDDSKISVTDFTETMAYFPVNRFFKNLAAGMTISVRRSGRASQQNMLQFAQYPSADSDGESAYKIGSAYNAPLDEGLGVVNGTSYRLETQIEVRWAWVAFPAVLMIMAAGFLVVTILQTRRSGVPLFKSSSIPLVCSGLDNEIQESLRLVNDPVAKDDASSTVMAKFVKSDDKSWRMDAEAKEKDRQM